MIGDLFYFVFGTFVAGGLFILLLSVINASFNGPHDIWTKNTKRFYRLWIVSGMILTIIFWGR